MSEGKEPRPEDFWIRCLHIDYAREPSEEDLAAGERHWRCPNRVGYEVGVYCPQHGGEYVERERATPDEVHELIDAAAQAMEVAARRTMPGVAPRPRGPWTFRREPEREPETPERVENAEERKAEIRRRLQEGRE